MSFKCHKCDKEMTEENFYCPECYSYLKEYQQKQKPKPKEKVNYAKAIHDSMFG